MTPADAPKRRRGRPKNPQNAHTMVVSVRIHESVYDRYCVKAHRVGVNVRSVIRKVLTLHAPATPSAT